MNRRIAYVTVLALTMALTAPLAQANPAAGQGGVQVTVSAGAQARIDALHLSVVKLTEAKALLSVEAQLQVDAAIALLNEQAAAGSGQAAGNAKAAEASLLLQAVLANPAISAEAKAQLELILSDLQAKLGITQAEDSGEASKPDQTGADRANAARATAGARLQSLLEAGGFANGGAQVKIEALVTKLTTELTTAGEAGSEQEALAAVEAAVEAKANKTAAEMDVQAEAEVRQGKKVEARATLKARLAANPHTQTAYEKLIGLETEAGQHAELDTYVRGAKVEFDVRPLIKENRTLMPIRALVESLGATVTWNAETRVVTITKDGKTIELQIDSQVALVNGEEVSLEVPAQIEGDRTVVPARFISEGLGLYVKWLAESRTILVTEEPIAAE